MCGPLAAAAALFAGGQAGAENLPGHPAEAPAKLLEAPRLPAETQVTLARTETPAKVTVATGAQPARVTTGGAGELARVTVAGILPGAQVIASRQADIVGRPIDIFRPISLNGPTAFPSRMPVASRRVTSGFGYRTHPILGGRRAHSGVDLAAAYGSPVVATADGIVREADWRGGYGLLVAVESGGVQTRYGHLSRLNVAAGQRVRQGDVIGYVGSTGRSTGPHLHYEVRVNGQPVDPMRAKAK